MKAIVFAGGIGTRMWPLSRKASPKQFEPIFEGKSTLQLTLDRLRPEFNFRDIYLSTGIQYVDLIRRQLPDVPPANIIGEPEMRDVGPAVGYLLSLIAKTDPDSPVAIIWSDHLINRVSVFKQAILGGGQYLLAHPGKYIFIGQKARFANQNLGWIEYGSKIDTVGSLPVHTFESWHYRPPLAQAEAYFKDGKHAWNPGYFVVTPSVVLKAYQEYAPQMYSGLMELQSSYGTNTHEANLNRIYPKFDKISFDDLIISKLPKQQAVVLSVDMDWSDAGTWEAYKEAFRSGLEANLTQGNIVIQDTLDSVVYNQTPALLAALDLKGLVVVATPDAILVCPQASIPKIKEMLKSFEGTPLEKYT